MMIASAVPRRLPVYFRAASEFAAAPDQCAVEQSAGCQIFQECGQPPVEIRALQAHPRKVTFVRIPSAGIIDHDIRHTGFDQPAGNQTFLPEGVASVAVAQFVVFIGEVEHFFARSEDQFIGLIFGDACIFQHGRAHGLSKQIGFSEQFATGGLTFIADSFCDNSFDLKARVIGIPAGGERFIHRSEKAFFRKASLRLGQYHIGRNQSFVTGIFKVGKNSADAGIGDFLLARVAGLHVVGGGFVTVDSVSHAADQ